MNLQKRIRPELAKNGLTFLSINQRWSDLGAGPVTSSDFITVA